ncbi:uncharacterized protein BCR38DRAFT_423781 [Pseudomassariella vexata]|uniref:DUF1772-domain-containing protein n=1 Tax=Pseudomassariella vexata TaxID=1141098 RepID=A0A1Y2EBA9_9PEZI|nr:uncharacterized protein BCR38DRAFT_423781 [Pseudomassariella vexata]ORY68584.1 hypothetical protein BCR38DRAFT_423781 [Pseudomassariella vexata]
MSCNRQCTGNSNGHMQMTFVISVKLREFAFSYRQTAHILKPGQTKYTMSEHTTPIRLAQATSILVATALAGANAGLSFFVIPRLLESPTPLMIRQWGNMFAITHRYLPSLFMLPGFINIWLAYRLPEKVRLYALAAGLSISISPYTMTIMRPINKKLEQKVKDVRVMDFGNRDVLAEEFGREETAHSLIDSWGVANLYLCSASFLAGTAGLYAAFR